MIWAHARFQAFEQELRSWGLSSRRPFSTGPLHGWRKRRTQHTLFPGCHSGTSSSCFAEPEPELHTGVQIKRIVKVGEDQLVRMLIVYHGHGVPQSWSVLYRPTSPHQLAYLARLVISCDLVGCFWPWSILDGNIVDLVQCSLNLKKTSNNNERFLISEQF